MLSYWIWLRRVLWLVGRAFVSGWADNIFQTAKGVAFSATLALFPGLLFTAALFIGGNASPVILAISDTMGTVLPPSVHQLLDGYLSVPSGWSTFLLLLCGGVSVYSGAEMMISLMEGFRSAYRLPHLHSAWEELGIALWLLLITVAPLTMVSATMVFGRPIEIWIGEQLGNPEYLAGWLRAGRLLIGLLAFAAVLAALYKYGVARRQRWVNVIPGALVATTLWIVSTEAFSFYVQNLARYKDVYGSVSVMIVLLIWLYIVSVVVMLGCEYNAELERYQAEWVEQGNGGERDMIRV